MAPGGEARTFEHRRELFEDFYQAVRLWPGGRTTTVMASTTRLSCLSTGTPSPPQSSTVSSSMSTGALHRCRTCL